MINTTISEDRTKKIWNDKLKMRFQVRGEGPPLVYLHHMGGLVWDEFLGELARSYTIYAPIFPGFDPADPFAVHHLDDIYDVVLAYEDALRNMGLKGVPVVGHSFGGLLASEIASTFTDIFSKVVLLAPGGLWNEAHPWSLDFMSDPLEILKTKLFRDPNSPRAKAMFPPPKDASEELEMTVNAIWATGCVAKFAWPIPDRGSSKRLHRIAAPTLIIWGVDDKIIPSAYAHEYGKRINASRVELLPECGHIPQVELMESTFKLVSDFLKEPSV